MNLRPSGYEPDELPGCSTPRYCLAPGLPGFCFGCPPCALRFVSWLPVLFGADVYVSDVVLPGVGFNGPRRVEAGVLLWGFFRSGGAGYLAIETLRLRGFRDDCLHFADLAATYSPAS